MDRDDRHDALSVFVGRRTARGTSFGGTEQSASDPKANGQPWFSTHDCYWHTGKIFLVQDEKADIAGARFDTLALMGVADDRAYFCRSIENHGYYRDYKLERDGTRWIISGELERAEIRFEEGGKRQVISWERKQNGKWLPLCDRVASRVE